MTKKKALIAGERISDPREFLRLAKEKKAVVWKVKYRQFIRPAAFILEWSLSQILKNEFYYVVDLAKMPDKPRRVKIVETTAKGIRKITTVDSRLVNYIKKHTGEKYYG